MAPATGLELSTVSFIVARSGSKPVDGGTTVLADFFHMQPANSEQEGDGYKQNSERFERRGFIESFS